ncbi:6163_t:CDS:10, partial [Acaulospora colombiana]
LSELVYIIAVFASSSSRQEAILIKIGIRQRSDEEGVASKLGCPCCFPSLGKRATASLVDRNGLHICENAAKKCFLFDKIQKHRVCQSALVELQEIRPGWNATFNPAEPPNSICNPTMGWLSVRELWATKSRLVSTQPLCLFMEDDRAAKAARAKALLNKRRANKAPTPGANSTEASTQAHPSPPGSTYSPSVGTPTPASPAVNTVNLKEEEPSSGPTNHERQASTESRRDSRSNGHDPYAALVRTRSPISSPSVDESPLQRLVQNQQQTISLLVSEKASLAAALERLEGLDEKYGSVAGQLEASKRAAQTLEGRSRDLEIELSRVQKQNEQFTTKDKASVEALRQKERDLELSRKEAEDMRKRADQLETKLRDLQEQIQADDRVERLQASLKSSEERSQSLETQLARTKQDEAIAKLNSLKAEEEKLRSEHQSLHAIVDESKAKIDSLSAELDSLRSAHEALIKEAKKHASTVDELTRKISVEGGKSTMQEKKLKALQNELAAAKKHADEAEAAHKNLQNENVGLMASLNEMRPRLMQLTEEKLNLTEAIEKLEEDRHVHEKAVSDLEVTIEELRARCETLEGEKAKLEGSLEAERDAMDQDMERLQQALSQTEAELQRTVTSVKDLETERGIHRQAVERYQIEMDKLDAELADLRAQYTTLQDDFAASQNAREQDANILEESHAVVQRANAEVEALRNEVLSKEEEIEQLKAEAAHTNTKPQRGHQRNPSLDNEMFESDGTFELSQARSRIRNLETTIFQEQAKAHNLRKQVNSLEEELHRLRRTSRPHQVTPTFQSPALSHKDLPLETPLDSALPPDVRHKRKISLSMLRARIDGEAALSHSAGGLGASPRPSLARNLSSSLHPMQEEETETEADEKMPLKADPGPSGSSSHIVVPRIERRRPQFLDDSHVFWCSCCRGDLVVL